MVVILHHEILQGDGRSNIDVFCNDDRIKIRYPTFSNEWKSTHILDKSGID